MTASPYINHFVQPDTIVPNLYNPQSLNRYSYVQNNPIRYSDPTGHVFEEDTGGVGGPCNTTDCNVIINNAVPKPKKPDDELKTVVPSGPGCTDVPYAICLDDSDDILNYFPSTVELHPIDNYTVGLIPIYSSNGTIIGYRRVYYVADLSSFAWNSNTNGAINNWSTTYLTFGVIAINYISTNASGTAVCPICEPALLTVTTLDLINQTITFDAQPQISPMIPVNHNGQSIFASYHSSINIFSQPIQTNVFNQPKLPNILFP